MKLTKNFKLKEMSCKCGCDTPNEVLSNIKILAVNLQILRDYLNTPIKINSAYRCENHNKSVGGSKNSQHLLGKAADIYVKGFSTQEIFDIVQNLRRNPMLEGVIFQGLGIYNTFNHLDIREDYTVWDFRK